MYQRLKEIVQDAVERYRPLDGPQWASGHMLLYADKSKVQGCDQKMPSEMAVRTQ